MDSRNANVEAGLGISTTKLSTELSSGIEPRADYQGHFSF